MGDRFIDVGMSGDEFRETFTTEVVKNYHAVWTLFAPTAKGTIPVGWVLGFYSHPEPKMSPFMIVGDMLWGPWATARNRIESAVNFFNRIRDTIPMIEYASEDDKRFFEMIARHGIMRRVGTTYNVKYGEPVGVFETIKKAT